MIPSRSKISTMKKLLLPMQEVLCDVRDAGGDRCGSLVVVGTQITDENATPMQRRKDGVGPQSLADPPLSVPLPTTPGVAQRPGGRRLRTSGFGETIPSSSFISYDWNTWTKRISSKDRSQAADRSFIQIPPCVLASRMRPSNAYFFPCPAQPPPPQQPPPPGRPGSSG